MRTSQPDTETKLAPLQILGVVGPSLCIVHCLAMPLLLGVLPVLGVTKTLPCCIDDQLIALVVLPICLGAILPGYLAHRQARVLAFLFLGMSLVLFGSFAADQVLGHFWEIPVNISGSFFLIRASLLNLKLGGCSQSCTSHPVAVPVAADEPASS